MAPTKDLKVLLLDMKIVPNEYDSIATLATSVMPVKIGVYSRTSYENNVEDTLREQGIVHKSFRPLIVSGMNRSYEDAISGMTTLLVHAHQRNLVSLAYAGPDQEILRYMHNSGKGAIVVEPRDETRHALQNELQVLGVPNVTEKTNQTLIIDYLRSFNNNL